ncbi:MAG TPA: TadE/TadG family type IV pilus assembly protein [Caulobacterales bacterium]|nr:TadE/TadG family type IV pilus assembly protein [Caulobacterales bacterium]
MKLKGLIRRRGGAKSGATALEFALLSPIFFVIMFAIIEAGAVYIGESWLQFATNDVGRQVRTGEVQLANTSKTQFRALVCAKTTPFLPCDANLQVDVQAYSDFTTASLQQPISGGVLNSALNNYNPGTACQVVIVRNFYKWTLQTPFFTNFLVNLGTNQRLLSAAFATRNEPFTSAVTGC